MGFLLEIRAEIEPTEDKEKVIKAIKNIFPYVEISVEDNIIYGKSNDGSSLDRFFELIKVQRIVDAALRYLDRSTTGNVVEIKLNRLAAYRNSVNFSSSARLPIYVKITTEHWERIRRELEKCIMS